MREMSAGTLCVVIIACLSLASVASEPSLEDGVSSGWETVKLIEIDNLESADSSLAAIDDSDAVLSAAVELSLSLLPSWTAESNLASAGFGYSVASAGDVNGDGLDDVVVGAYGYTNGEENEGCAYLYLGSASGLCATPSWTAEGNQTEANLGMSVASAGDVNGDCYDDVVIGAQNYDNGETNEGRAYLYFGAASGLSTLPSWTAESDQAYAGLGNSIASAGDVNGDGYDDVVVGAPGYDNGEENEGRAYLYLGSASGPSGTPSWAAESNQANVWYGASVASAGDVNGDGYDDVVIGAPGYDNDGISEGRIYLYLGSPSGLSSTPSWTAEGDQNSGHFGISAASAGDVNGDGYDDVVAGALWYDNGETDEGRAYLYLGSPSGLSSTPSWTAEGNQANARFSWSVSSAGDVNGDGFDEVVVGAWPYDNGETDEGRAYLYLGSPSGLSSTPSWIAEGNQANARFGRSVASAGDVNGDGYDDVVIGADTFDNDEMNEGRAFLYLGGEYLTEDEKSFIESYGLALGIVIALAIVAMVLFFVLKGRKGGKAPTSMEEVSVGEPEVHNEIPRPG